MSASVKSWWENGEQVKIFIGLILLLLAGPALAEPEAQDVAKAESWLNQVKTLKARFLQVSPDGGSVEGTVSLWRPGRLRLDYDPPSPILLIADGSWLIYYDRQLDQTSYVDLDSSPAGILVRSDVKLDSGDLKLVKIGHQPGLLEITVTKRDDPGEGRITLVFTEAPFQLRQWRVVDPEGKTTTVSLYDTRTGVELDKKQFEFHDPHNTGQPDLSGKGK
ncbi:MAG TPA: outer membrane lipoprotein carrier protein LolA [Rhodospirillaceae bacterium]|nr:outer membrane lipoprotein carrier protein LolA [Rhodospirillaceae bacterium]